MSAWWQDFKGWIASPTQSEATPLHMFYLVGLYVVFVLIWIIILNHLIAALRAA